jgi:hypothetical protein
MPPAGFETFQQASGHRYRLRSPDRPARSESLYRMRYLGPVGFDGKAVFIDVFIDVFIVFIDGF